jgi:hypothetical protein
MILLSVGGLAMNQFATIAADFEIMFWRLPTGRTILLGKNLALAPVTLSLSALVLALLQWFVPMQLDHFVGVCARQ